MNILSSLKAFLYSCPDFNIETEFLKLCRFLRLLRSDCFCCRGPASTAGIDQTLTDRQHADISRKFNKYLNDAIQCDNQKAILLNTEKKTVELLTQTVFNGVNQTDINIVCVHISLLPFVSLLAKPSLLF